MVWNTRGFKVPKKKREIVRSAKEKCVDIIGALEMNSSRSRQMHAREFFNGEWRTIMNIAASNGSW